MKNNEESSTLEEYLDIFVVYENPEILERVIIGKKRYNIIFGEITQDGIVRFDISSFRTGKVIDDYLRFVELKTEITSIESYAENLLRSSIGVVKEYCYENRLILEKKSVTTKKTNNKKTKSL